MKTRISSASIPPVIDDPAIGTLREQIDAIDRQILQLLKQRLNVVHQVGEEKREKGLAVFDPKREERLLQKLISLAPEGFDESSIRNIFSAVVAECRRLETEQINA